MVSNNWKKGKLSDLSETIMGFAFKSEDFGWCFKKYAETKQVEF